MSSESNHSLRLWSVSVILLAYSVAVGFRHLLYWYSWSQTRSGAVSNREMIGLLAAAAEVAGFVCIWLGCFRSEKLLQIGCLVCVFAVLTASVVVFRNDAANFIKPNAQGLLITVHRTWRVMSTLQFVAVPFGSLIALRGQSR